MTTNAYYTYVGTTDPKLPPHFIDDSKNAGTHMGLRELALVGELLKKDAEAVVKGAGFVALAIAFRDIADALKETDEERSKALAELSGLAFGRGIDLTKRELNKPL
jgi:hypothetical protein